MQLRLFFALLTLVILGLAIASTVYIVEKVEKPKGQAVKTIKESKPEPIDPGIREYDAALALIQNRQLQAAQEKLRYIIQYFPNSSRAEEAKRLCGEINVDLLVSPAVTQGKTRYEVQKGDAVSRIAAKQQTTLEYLKRANQLTDFRIQPGDNLLVKPLQFKVQASLKSKRVTLSSEGEFFKEYPILGSELPKGVVLPFETKVRSKLAWLDKKNVPVTEAGYDQAEKHIRLRRPGLSIRPEESTQTASKTGIFMDPADVDELCLLLRVGAAINVTH